MGENSKIAWTDHTFNPWWGCAKVSEGCKNCYAETFAARFGVKWGATSTRRFFGEKHWNEPRKWNAAAQKAGVRAQVFCASMADVFDGNGELDGERAKLWKLIGETPWLDWLLLTKRPANIAGMVPWGDKPPANVWLGTTVEGQAAADERIPLLLQTPAAVRFLSVEPMLEAITLTHPEVSAWPETEATHPTANPKEWDDWKYWMARDRGIHWVIVGGESGAKARPFHVEWARSIRDQCKEAGVSFFMKQMGAHAVETLTSTHGATCESRCAFRDRAGANPAEWPEDLRIQQMPKETP
jgi:protein gp37